MLRRPSAEKALGKEDLGKMCCGRDLGADIFGHNGVMSDGDLNHSSLLFRAARFGRFGVWCGMWCALMITVLALSDSNAAMWYFSQFTKGVFSALIIDGTVPGYMVCVECGLGKMGWRGAWERCCK